MPGDYDDAFAEGQALGVHPWWYARHKMEDQLVAERAAALLDPDADDEETP